MYRLLSDNDYTFPDIRDALDEAGGLLAVGGDLAPARLLEAYRRGIFPWFEAGQPILWWSPNPRCVIRPEGFIPSKSLGKRLRKQDYRISIDTDFPGVIEHCQVRGAGENTWITDDMKVAYMALHRQGYAHSVECYMEGKLVGGLYGLSLGRLFFGESMFHRITDASKIAFAALMALMKAHQCPLVDCQIANPHLFSLGAEEIPRSAFRGLLAAHVDATPIPWPDLKGPWVV